MKYKLYSTKPGQGNKKAILLAEGSVEDIVEFINSVGDGNYIGKVDPEDLEENGGNWGFPPDDWTPESPFYHNIGDRQTGVS